MTLKDDERAEKAHHAKLLKRRARAIRKKNLSNAERLARLARKSKQRLQSIGRKRRGTFVVSQLDGHPANITDAVKRVVALAYEWAEHKNTVCTVTATTDGTHATNSYHYPAPPTYPLGRAADINFATDQLEVEFQDYLRAEIGLQHFYELLGPSDWALYTSGLAGGPAPGHSGANSHDHCAPRPTFRKR